MVKYQENDIQFGHIGKNFSFKQKIGKIQSTLKSKYWSTLF